VHQRRSPHRPNQVQILAASTNLERVFEGRAGVNIDPCEQLVNGKTK
jgi:hypothetical protein